MQRRLALKRAKASKEATKVAKVTRSELTRKRWEGISNVRLCKGLVNYMQVVQCEPVCFSRPGNQEKTLVIPLVNR